MNPKLYFICFGVALIGLAFQTALKMKSERDKAKVANVKFSVRGYISEEWLSYTISILAILMVLVCLDSGLKWKPVIVDFVKPIFAFVGYTGGDIVSRIFGVYSKRINKIIDTKTDIADGKV